MDQKKEDDILNSLEEEMFEEDESPKSTEDLSALSNEINQKMDELQEALKPEQKKEAPQTKPEEKKEETAPKIEDSKLKKLAEEIRNKIPQVMDCTLINTDGSLISSTMIDNDESEIFGRTTARLTESSLRALKDSAYGDCDHIILTGTDNQIVVKPFGEHIVATKLDKNTNIGMYLIKVKSLLKDKI